MERLQLLPRRGSAAPQPAAQRRIGHQSPSQHHRPHLGVLAAEVLHLRRGEQVAVIHRRLPPPRQCQLEGVTVHRPAVELLLHPRVDDELRHGVFPVDGQQPLPLRRIVLPDAGLDRHPHVRQRRVDLLQTPIQLLRIGQQPCPLALGGDGAGGTSQIEVDLPNPHGVQLPRRPHEVVPAVGQQLGHRVRLPLRHLIQFLLLECQVPVGRQERRKILVHTAEYLPLGPAPDVGGQPLHGRGV